jgi:hypothetical protein
MKGANDYSLDQMCGIVSVDILSRLGMGVIGKDTIKGFYRGENLNSKNLEKIGAWIIHETEIKMAEMVKMVKMVKIISTWTLPKVEMAEITSYYIILIRYK